MKDVKSLVAFIVCCMLGNILLDFDHVVHFYKKTGRLSLNYWELDKFCIRDEIICRNWHNPFSVFVISLCSVVITFALVYGWSFLKK